MSTPSPVHPDATRALHATTPAVGSTGLIIPTFPQRAPTPDVAQLTSWAHAAEAAGAGALWVTDHLFWPTPCLECLTTMTVLVAATTTIPIGSCVLQLPLRHPSAVAKQVSSLQTLSDGRVILGVGVGSHPGEYEQVGSAYHRRGHDLDTAIAELHRSWHTGQHIPDPPPPLVPPTQAASYQMLPTPPSTPIWVGGSSLRALQRVARQADGWIPLFLTPDEYASALSQITDQLSILDRPHNAITPAMVLFVSIDDDQALAHARGTAWMGSMYNTPPRAFDRHLVSGSAHHVANQLRAWREAGAVHIAVYVTDDDPLEQGIALLAAEAEL